MSPIPELPAHLDGKSAQGFRLGEPVAQLEIGDYRNFVYLILDWESREAAIVDPQRDLEPLFAILEPNGFRLGGVLLTHTHHDHVAGLAGLAKRAGGKVPVWVHPRDRDRLSTDWLASYEINDCRDGGEIRVGKLALRILHTPGHSPGECCYYLEAPRPYLWTGDTVFIRDCGRTDLAGGNNEEMFASLQRIRQLPSETVILPGHHYAPECASTLARELRDSAPFRCRSVAELASLP